VRLIKNKILVAALCATAIGMSPMLYVSDLLVIQKALLVITSLCLCATAVKVCTAQITNQLDALEIGLLNFKDGEFSSTLACKTNDEFETLCQLDRKSVVWGKRGGICVRGSVNKTKRNSVETW